ncbi:hypothetical protein O181_015192 [Austropuccinia psidii MF-1]|uniref:Uncharacterized protein n=1 Tax=Austropuccinia psidii MF-1 TaxID=1389203 RepID=A0A9Q3C1N1_9BASI|nr:hypothetical protein [Austropuccinia psidii MF-1]
MQKMTSAQTADHLLPLPCLLSCMNWLLHQQLTISPFTMLMLIHGLLIISSIYHSYASSPLQPHLHNSACLHSCTTLSSSQFTILTLTQLLTSALVDDHFHNLPSFCSCKYWLLHLWMITSVIYHNHAPKKIGFGTSS